jgi:hypothetical protein
MSVIRTKSVDREPAVVPGEHVGGGSDVEQALESEPADHAAPHPLGERGQVDLSDRSDRQERRRGVAACLVSSLREWQRQGPPVGRSLGPDGGHGTVRGVLGVEDEFRCRQSGTGAENWGRE